ncbi:DUF4998 domain-containing protein [Pedobacter nyackensis]|uniref:DUF4998 domain-containing protein n=1 Tax=Pedobacter nyackensis TaxID=475255 RepID=A0A1W2AAD6_9SPHI|nr:DUF4998 domain-containing protein [Pedobacter nyackensis]SMC57543.1 protein of unknown function [Pedobacter nyackensis]
MKIKCKTLIVSFVTFLVVSVLTSCDKGMYDVSGEFYHRGEDLYLGVVDSIKVKPGYNRAKLSWEIKADPRITKTVIYWNKRQDSTVVDVVRNNNGRVPMEIELKNLNEKDYIFEFIAKNDKGLFSIPKQISISVFGDVFIKGLKNRAVASITKQQNGDLSIVWNPIASSSILYTTLKYEGIGGSQEVRVENISNQTILKGVKPGSNIKVSTSFFLPGTLDVMNVLDQLIFIFS